MEYESTTDIKAKFIAVCRAHRLTNDLYWLIDVQRTKVLAIRKELLKEKIAIQPFVQKIHSECNIII